MSIGGRLKSFSDVVGLSSKMNTEAFIQQHDFKLYLYSADME